MFTTLVVVVFIYEIVISGKGFFLHTPFEQMNPFSTLHYELQPSPSFVLPSSQSSSIVRIPSPHLVTQLPFMVYVPAVDSHVGHIPSSLGTFSLIKQVKQKFI